ncbi:MAG: ABC transporter permease [Actinomycetota bacterium]|nr:ABC transporter permease [Actinomycetota bacterium]
MTTTITLSDSVALRPAARLTTRTSRDDLHAVPAAITSEWIKLRSLRANRAIFGLTAVVGVVMSWVLATFVKTDPYEHLPFTVANTFMTATWLTMVLAIIAGILLYTSEVQHGTLGNTITAQPARWVTVAAKALVAAAFGLAMGVVGIVTGYASAVASGMPNGDTSGAFVDAAWGLVLTTFAAVLGVGVGMLIRHSAAAVSTALVWTFVIENLLRSMAPANLTRFLPFSSANGLLSIRSAGDTTATLAAALSRPQDALLFGGYTLLALLVGTLLVYRRDA